MIAMQTVLRITDNSGVKKIKCIKFYKKTLQSNITIKSNFIGSIQKLKLKKKTKLKKLVKGELKTGIVVRTIKKIWRFDGSSLNFKENSAVLVDKKKNPLATRVLGVVPFEFRHKKTFKIVLLSSGTV